jgi:hypothetical protein
MAFDLRSAMLKKQEVESARLAEFDYRWRARTPRPDRGTGRPDAAPAGVADRSG